MTSVRGSVLPVLEEVVAGEVGLVAERDERRQADAARPGEVERGDAEGAALRGEADPAGRRRAGREARVERDVRVGVDHAEAVGADQPHAGGAADGEQLALALAAPSSPTSAKPARDDDQRAHAGRAALARDVHDRSAGTASTASSGGLGDLAHARRTRAAPSIVAAWGLTG